MRAIEVKVKGSAYASILAGAVIAVLNEAVSDNTLLGSLPAWLQVLLLMVVPGAITWLGGFVTPSKTSTTSDAYSSPE